MKKTQFYLILFFSAILLQTAQAQKQISINAAQKKQTIDGFGGSIAYYEGWLTAHAKRAAIYDYIFRDMGLSIFRTRNMYMNEGANNQGINDTRTIFLEAKKRSTFDVLISSWSPAGKYKSNGKPANDETMATLATDTAGNFVYGGFANWWYKSLLDYKAKGIDVKYISIQNEPNWNPGYEGCIFMPQEQTVYDKKLAKNVKVASYSKAFNAVYDTLAKYSDKLNITPKMIGPEVLGIENAWSGRPGEYTKYMDMTKCYAVAHHLYTGTDPATMVNNMTILNTAYPKIPKWQTEYSENNWLTLAQVIHNSLVIENVSAYLVWDLFWPGENGLINLENPWTSSTWVNKDGYKILTKYYMFKQFAYFIKPGWFRVDATNTGTTIKSSAYMSPDGKNMSIVVLNTGTTIDSIAIKPSAFTIASGKIYRTTDSLNCSFMGDYTERTIKLPAKSITTFSLTGLSDVVAIENLPVNVDDALIFPNPFSDEATLDLSNYNQQVEIEIYNLFGQRLYHEKSPNLSSVKIGTGLAKGLYILSINDGNKRINKKIVKQ